MPTCQHCHRPIEGRYLNALGHHWHPECFRCAGCGQPITPTQFTVEGDRPYHPACYQERFGLRCAICGDFIEGRYFTDLWDNRYCARHQQEYPPCHACQRLVCQSLTGGGVRYNDGRIYCRLCRATAIDTPEQAHAVTQQVQARMARYGVDTRPWGPFELKMTPLSGIVEPGEDPATTHRRGRTETQTEYINHQETNRRIQVIHLLGGMPETLFAGVMAHELGHVWLFMHHADDLPKPLAEGLCNLFAYLTYRELNTAETRVYLRQLEEDPDPVYGDGFRRALRWYQQAGLSPLLQTVLTRRDWPPQLG